MLPKRFCWLILALAVSLQGRAVLDIPDSLLSNRHASTYYIQSPDTSLTTIQVHEQVSRRDLWLIVSSVVVLMLIIQGLTVLYYNRMLQLRNKKLVSAYRELAAYRWALISHEDTTEKAEEKADADKSVTTMTPDERLFVEMDKVVTRDRLFLDPNFGRDDLMRLCGVDKNRFGRIIAQYSDASNTSVYLNTKRVEYGAKLLIQNPNYTIAAIAEQCGMGNAVTFNRTFKSVFGMPPSEFRRQRSEGLGGGKTA